MASMIVQAGAAGTAVVFEFAIVQVAGRCAAAADRGQAVVDVVPVGVDRQILGDIAGAFGGGLRQRFLGAIGRFLGKRGFGAGLAAGLAFLVHLQQRIGIEGFLDFGLQFQRGQLQEPDGLLQLGGHGQMLTETEL